MAVLSTADREHARDRLVRRLFLELARTGDLDVNELLLLVEDVDAWLDSQTTEANQAIRVAIRNKASTSTKFAALAIVAMKRAGMI